MEDDDNSSNNSNNIRDRRESPRAPPGGASDLLGLFAPPTPTPPRSPFVVPEPPARASETNDRREPPPRAPPVGASDLLGLFAPPSLPRASTRSPLMTVRVEPARAHETDALLPAGGRDLRRGASTGRNCNADIDDDENGVGGGIERNLAQATTDGGGGIRLYPIQNNDDDNDNDNDDDDDDDGDGDLYPIHSNDDGDDNDNDDLTATIRTFNQTPKCYGSNGDFRASSKLQSTKNELNFGWFSPRSSSRHRQLQQPEQQQQQKQQQQQQQQQQQRANRPLQCHEEPTPNRGLLYLLPPRALQLLSPLVSPSTWVGGILFVLYHVVFCMASGGSIVRPHSGVGMLGDTARYTALGILVSCPWLVYSLEGIPALYPSVDLFLAPFLARAAAAVDECLVEDLRSGALTLNLTLTLEQDPGEVDYDPIQSEALTRLWFGSFAVVVAFGLFLSGSLLLLASRIKLANLGTYLPYGVLCGFFSAVGILLWKLALRIDAPPPYSNYNSHNHNHSNTAAAEVATEEWGALLLLLLHHLPSVAVGLAMNRLGPRHPFFVAGLVLCTIGAAYATLYATGTSLEEARAGGWFYSPSDLASHHQRSAAATMTATATTAGRNSPYDFLGSHLPPSPLGAWVALAEGEVHWAAVARGSKHMVALAVLYLLRSSIHATALKKNVHNLVRRVPVRRLRGGNSKNRNNNHHNHNSSNSNNSNIHKNSVDVELSGGRPSPVRRKRHRRNPSVESVSAGFQMALDGASQLAESVRNEVLIVNMSLTDRQSLPGKCCVPPKAPPGSVESGSIPLRDDCVPPPTNDTDDGRVSSGPQHREYSGHATHRASPAARSLPPPSAPATRTLSGGSEEAYTTNPRHETHGTDYREIHAPASDVPLETIFVRYGQGFFVAAAFGGFGCCPTIATSNTMYAIGAGGSAPQYLSLALLFLAFSMSGFDLVRFIPKTAFSALLVLGAVDNFVTWFLRPLSRMATVLEWSVVPFIAALSLMVGFLEAVVLGIGLSTFLFVTDFFRVGVVKHDASGLEIRSRIERSLVQSVWLDTHGDYLRVMVLQNYLFFGNASSLLRYVETMFEAIPPESVGATDYSYSGASISIPPIPVVLVLDLSLITGMDTSTVDVFTDIWRLCKRHDCKLYMCGLSPRMKNTFGRGGIKPDKKGPRKSRSLLYFSDLDHGLGRAEDVLIDMKMGNLANPSLFAVKNGKSGFHVALQHIDQLHSTNNADSLLELEPHTMVVTLQKGQILFEKDGGVIRESDHGLFFVESGMMREDDDAYSRTNTRTGGSFRRNSVNASASALFGKGNDNSIGSKHARLDTAAQRAALTKLARDNHKSANHRTSKSMRIATAGPGWVIGTHEFATGQHPLNKFRAITAVKMHHLRFSDLTRIEHENPTLVLKLYKMLTHVMARKEEDTVAHLSTLHNILSSSAHSTKPVPRLSVSGVSETRKR